MGSPKPDFSGRDGKMLGPRMRLSLAHSIVNSLSYPQFRIIESSADNRMEVAPACKGFLRYAPFIHDGDP
jgi:hypothetical protein